MQAQEARNPSTRKKFMDGSKSLQQRVVFRLRTERDRQAVRQTDDRRSGARRTVPHAVLRLAGGGGHAYTSSKHALAGFTKQLALDYAEAGVQVFGIAPGAVKTGMTAADFEPGGLADWVASETPIKRWIEPEEVAEVSLFLASGKASAMQGQILTIDGGWSLK